MEPERFGRTIGIGMRVASNILRDRAARAAQPERAPAAPQADPAQQPDRPAPPPRQPAPSRASVSRRAAETSRGVGHGAKKFGQAFWGPLHKASSVLWLEVTGLFFALFALFFAQNLYQVRSAWRQGGEHAHFVLYLALTGVFVWFSASSFLRARRRSRPGR